MEENVMNEKSTGSEGPKGITNNDLTRVLQGLVAIGNCDIDDFETNSILAKNITNFTEIEKVYNKTLNALMKKHIQIDAEKNIFKVENNFFVYKSAQDQKDYEEAYEKLSNTPVNAEVLKIKASVLKTVKPTIKAITLAQIHEFIDTES